MAGNASNEFRTEVSKNNDVCPDRTTSPTDIVIDRLCTPPPTGNVSSPADYLLADYPGVTLRVDMAGAPPLTRSMSGREGEHIMPSTHRGMRIGVFTSGGDSQG
jgi:hypothetical protein